MRTDRVVLSADGRIVADGRSAELLANEPFRHWLASADTTAADRARVPGRRAASVTAGARDWDEGSPSTGAR